MTNEKDSRIGLLRTILVLSFLGVFLTNLPAAFAWHGTAGFGVGGDLPNDAVTYSLLIYNSTQTTPCNSDPDEATTWRFNATNATGDSSFDDNNDFNVTNTTGLTGTSELLYFYFCQSGTRRANLTLLVNDGDDIEMDLGLVTAAAAFHDDLANLNVYVCNNTVNGGTQLDTVASSTSATGYDQWYTMVNGRAGVTNNGGNQRDVFALIRNTTTSVCQFDNNVKAAKRINTDASANGENYGVQVTFEPDTKASGDLHTDLSGVILELLGNTDGNVSVGMVNQSGVIPSQTPDGLNDSADDYDLYYDNPSSGFLNFLLNGTDTDASLQTNITRVTGMPNGFTDYDFIVRVTGAAPIQIANIKTNFSLSMIANTTISGTSWTMYIPDNTTNTTNATYTFNFSVAIDGATNFTADRTVGNQSITAGFYDTGINVSRYFGEVHRDLKNATDDVISVFSDANCTTSLTSTATVNPYENETGNDYEIFFEHELGNDTYYVNATSLNNTIAWYSCGNAFNVARATSTNVSLNMLLTGYVPTTISQVAVELNTTDSASGVPHTVNTTSVIPVDGLYKVFLPNDTDNTAYALFYQGGTLRLNRSISLGGAGASSNVTINVTRISGEVHKDLKNNTDDLVTVHNSSICAAGGTLISSQTVNPADVAADVDYNQYFEQRVSITSYYVNFTAVSDSSTRIFSSCQNLTVSTGAAASNVNVSAIVRVNGSIATDLDSVTIDIDGDNTPEVNATENTAGSFSLYMVNDTDGSTWIKFGRGGNITLDMSGRNFGNGSSADVNNTINVSKISGALDAAFAVAGSGEGLRVIADWNVTPAVNYSNRWNITNAGSGDAAVEDYWIYFQHQIVDGVATTIYDIEFNESTSSVNRTFFWNNTQTINAGGSYDLDLLNRINGTVPSDLVQIRVSTNNTIVDVAVPNITAVGLVESGGTFSIYSPDIVAINGSFGFANRTAVTLRAQRPAQITVLINNTQLNITADREFNISKLRGDIPLPLAGDAFEIDFNVSNVCSDGNSAYSSNTTSSVPYTLNASEDFALYFEAASRTYFWLVCDGAALRLNRTISSTATSGTITRNVSQISGELHPSLDNGGAGNATNIRVFNTTDCSGTLISSEAISLVAAADAVDYNQTYESTNPNQILYVNVTGNSSLVNSGGGSTVLGQQFFSCVNATSILSSATVTGGENSNVSILTLVEGNVTFPVKSVSVNITGGQNLNDSYVTLFNSSFYYYLFTPAGDAGSDMVAWNVSTTDSQLLLSRERDLSSAAGATNVSFNVSSISGTLHADLDDQAYDDIQVFGGANCADRLSSQDIASSGANYLQYFETIATGVLYLNVTNYDGTNNFTTCINTTNTKPQAGFNATAYNVDRRVQGNATTGIGYAVIDTVTTDQVLEVNSTVVGTTPRSYRAYFSSDVLAHMLVYNTSNNLVLNRSSRTFDADAVINVSRLIGDTHTDLETSLNDLIEVYNDSSCAGRGATTLLSSATVNPFDASGADNDFTIYFEGYDGPTYYINATAVLGDGRQYITCGNSFITRTHDNATSADRRIFGILPNASTWNVTTTIAGPNASINITSIGINFKGGTGDDVNQSTNITDTSLNRYYLYVNSSTSSGVELSFYNYTASGKTTMLNLTGVDLAADTGRNVSKVLGEVDVSLEDGTDTITVCSDAGCGTTLSTRTTNPASSSWYDYEIYYNHSSSTTQNYTLNISDVNATFVLRSYLRFIPVSMSDNGGDTRFINLTRVIGTTREEANSNAVGNVNVTAYVDGNGSAVNSSTSSNVSGLYFLYLDNGAYVINSTTTGWVTGSSSQTVSGATGLDTSLLYVLKITVRDPTGNAINATVNVTNNTGSTSTSYDTYNVSSGGGVYYFNVSPTTYNRVNITVKKSGFNTIKDPDPQFTGDPISLSAIVQTAKIYNMTRIENLVAPTVTGPPDGFYNNSNITFTWNAVDGADTYEFQLDDTTDFSSTTNATNLTATSIRTSQTFTDSLYYWRVRAISGINTGGAWSEVRTVTIDTTTPSATINAPSARTNSSADTVSISASATDATAGVSNVTFYSGGCGTTQIGIVSSPPYQLVWNVTIADDGSKTLCARATDKAGNTGDSATVVMIVDKSKPNATLTSPAAGARLNGTVNIQTRVNDSLANISKVEFLVDGSLQQINTSIANFPSNADTTFSWDTTTVGDGGHLIAIIAYDTANNTNQTIAVSVSVDNGAPDNILIIFPINNTYVNDTLTITASASDAIVINRVEFYNYSTLIANDTAAPWQAAWVTGPDGLARLYATVYDSNNNILNSSIISVTVDNTAPTLTIQDPVSGTTVYKKAGGVVDVDYTYTEVNVDKVEINVSNSTTTVASKTITSGLTSGTSITRNDSTTLNSGTPDGTYNVSVRVIDKAGRSATTTVAQIVVVDNTQPTVSISSPTTGTINGTVTFVLSVSDTGGSGVWKTELYANGANVSINSTTSPYDRLTLSTTTLADGSYTIFAKAYDNSGNTRDSISVNLTIDNTGPYSIVITSPAVNGTYVTGTAVGIEASVGDAINVSRVEFYNGSTGDSRNLIANDTNNAPWLATWDTTGVNGIQELFATVYDNVNNRLNSSVRSVAVDNTAPATPTINWPANNSNVSGTVTINITATDANSGIAAVEVYDNGTLIGNITSEPFQLQWITTNFPDGIHNITARAIDKVGQRTYSGLLYFVRVANGKAVTVSITSPSNNTYQNGTITIVAQASAVLGVNRVEFYNGSTSDTRNLISTDETSPFSITWNTANAVDGTYSLIARALDNNATAIAVESIAITITTDNTAPTVTVQYPTATVYKRSGDALSVNYIYTETNPTSIQLNASNDSHTAGGATFSTGLVSGTNVVRNDSVIINPTALEGTYNVTAVILDRVSQRATSSSTQIVVVDNSAPTASITSPALGANVSGSITIATSVSDVGSAGINRVEFLVDGTVHLTNTTSPYGFTLNTTQFLDGIHMIALRAYDNANNSVQSSPINITTINVVPVVNITFPQNSSTTGTALQLQAVTSVNAICNYATDTGTTFAQMSTTGRLVHAQSLSSLAAGTHNVTIHCRNWADSYGANITVVWTVDTSGPQVGQVFALSVTNSDKTNGTVDINATASYSGPNGNLGGAEYYIAVYPIIPSSTPNGTMNATDGTFSTTQEDVTGRISLTGMADGDYWVCVIANTSNSLRGPRSCSTPFTLDTVLPIIRMYTPNNNTNTTDTTPTVTFSVEDARTGVNLSAINVTNGTNGATLSGFSSAVCTAVDYGANGFVQKYNCTFDAGTLADGHGINITVVARDNSWNQHNNNTNVTVNSTTAVTARLNTSDVIAIADGTYESGWSFTFNITLGSSTSNLTSVNATAVRIANWTRVGGTESIVTTGNTRMNYTDASGTARTYYVSHEYNTSDTIYPLRDGDAQSVPINGTVTIYVKIPSSTLAGSYSTTFTFGSWVVPLTGGNPT